MNDVARVVMNELILANATIEPLARPTARPNAHPARSAIRTEPVAFSTRSATSGDTTATAAMDTSNPPAIIVSVATDAAISSVACWSSTLRRFGPVRNPSVVAASTTNSVSVTQTMPNRPSTPR